jgi:hypothetical protein
MTEFPGNGLVVDLALNTDVVLGVTSRFTHW